MNFREPEVTSPWGYPAFWLVSAFWLVIAFWLVSVVTVIAMLVYFWRKQWILQSTARNVKEK